jgi:putative sugar O-methyltransferase
MLKLKNNLILLNLMMEDQYKQVDLYRPGIYWRHKSVTTCSLIKKYGLEDFRSSTNLIGESFTDMVYLDYRTSLVKKGILKYILLVLLKTNPIKRVFNNQFRITKEIYSQYLLMAKHYITNSLRYSYLKSRFFIPFSTLGNTLAKFYDENLKKEISIHYLNLLDQHDYTTHHVNYDSIKVVFEIGGGFGANCHLLIENYKNIKKIIYLDIPPNLYIGTQYLKSFYGDSVIDYTKTRNLREIKFKDNEELEIFCIAPWQIDLIKEKIDLFFNGHSFVEMPKKIVKNYIDKLLDRFTEHTQIILISYDNFNLSTTFHPDDLVSFFPQNINWIKERKPSLILPERNNFFYISTKQL